jgi:hypothetical protein
MGAVSRLVTPSAGTQRDDRLAANAFDLPARELLIGVCPNPLGVRAHELELDRRRACVDHEDVHVGTPPLRIVASLPVSMFPPETTQTTLPATRCRSAAASEDPPRSLGHDASALSEQSHGVGDLLDTRDERTAQERADERPHLVEHAHAADAIHEARRALDGCGCTRGERGP